jgi:hypothetical protein
MAATHTYPTTQQEVLDIINSTPVQAHIYRVLNPREDEIEAQYYHTGALEISLEAFVSRSVSPLLYGVFTLNQDYSVAPEQYPGIPKRR